MKKAEAIEKYNKYMEYARNTDIHRTPRKGLNSGAHGRAYERTIKMLLGNYRATAVTSAGRVDTGKRIEEVWKKIEIKEGASTLGTIDIDGNIDIPMLRADIVIYSPDYNPSFDARMQSYVLTAENFWSILCQLNLVYEKYSSQICKLPEEVRYKDKIGIQQYKTSNKKYNAFYDLLEEYGEPLNTWLDKNGIKSAI